MTRLRAVSPDADPGEMTAADLAQSLGYALQDSRTVLWTVVSADEDGNTRRVLWGHTTRAQAVEAAAQMVELARKYGEPVKRCLVARVVLEHEVQT